MFRVFEILLLCLLGTATLICVESKPAAHPILVGSGVPANSLTTAGKDQFADNTLGGSESKLPVVEKNQNNLTESGVAITTEASNTTKAPEEVVITIYAYSNHVEPKKDYTVSLDENCVNLERRWLRRVSSVDTHGSCIRMCQYKNCGGSCILVEPGSPYHNRLRILNFDKKTSSLRRC